MKAALPLHCQNPMEYALATGLRKSRVLQARWDEIDLCRRVMTIVGIKIKNGRPLQIPLNDDAMTVLAACQGQHETYVFTHNGEPFFSIENRVWKKALSEAGLTDFRWHDLRHTWASWHVQNGTTLVQLMALGGWKTFSMVQRYAHFNTSTSYSRRRTWSGTRKSPRPRPRPRPLPRRRNVRQTFRICASFGNGTTLAQQAAIGPK